MLTQNKINFLKWLIIYYLGNFLAPGGITFERENRDKFSPIIQKICSYKYVKFVMYLIIIFFVTKDLLLAIRCSFIIYFIFESMHLIKLNKTE